MRKFVVFLFLAAVLATVVLSASFSTRDAAINYFKDYKALREVQIANPNVSIVYTSDEVCRIDYYSGVPDCFVCFKYRFALNNTVIEENPCINTPESSTAAERTLLVLAEVRRSVKASFPREEVSYVKANLTGRRLI